ncbi:MAG: DNA replication and repair protein RecF [Bacteroidota bacterium]|nr:DNA replication and repair protein RecF [Bacteroidota bacterium]MDP4190731.1 DNA replication and repair protein RecF [Bacteroidota bacterium]MDP4196333.1 DNA replication and repair protein RecF [Bacteroidota bacterium]
MILRSILLKNFRIHQNTQVEFSDGINYIVGGNGQGKTSILEAVYYLCTTKGYNSVADGEVVSFNETFFEVSGTFRDLTENNLRIYYTLEDNRKYFFVDGKQIYRASSIIGKYPVVILTPEDHSITQGSPGDRRKFVDSVISQSSETYLQILLDYNRTLRQRSSLLAQIKESRDRSLLDQLDAWSQKLVQCGSELIKHRIRFVSEFNGYVNDSYNLIMSSAEQPSITYEYLEGNSLEGNGQETGKIEEQFTLLLEKKRDDELRRAVNLVGPHRDEFIFRINNMELKKYGSQGQNKTFQISLRFAQFFYLKDSLSKSPVFLMDDVFGELDTYRAQKISGYLQNLGQAFVTMTDFSNYSYLSRNQDDYLIKVHEGQAAYG